MDTVTQAVFGAVIGQAGFQSKLGWRALAAGAALATVPDLDVVASLADPLNEWRHHRGVTHSLFFGPVIGPVLGYAIWKSYQWRNARTPGKPFAPLGEAGALSAWIWLAVLALMTHPVLDVLTPYGTQLLAPFSDQRFAINAMSIIDPVYTGVLVLALVGGWLVRRGTFGQPGWSAHMAGAALVASVVWQGYAWSVNTQTEDVARAALEKEGVTTARVIAYPTLFQPWFRRLTAETEDAIRVGYYSPLADETIEWRSFPKPQSELIRDLSRTMEYRVLERFAMGEIAWRIVPTPDGHTRVEAHDLRYLGYDDNRLAALWGISAVFDRERKLVGAPERFSNRPEPSANIFSVMWTGAFGE
ncbi:MAG: metal-dependent hydrolase [Parvibaculaceae bacterium]